MGRHVGYHNCARDSVSAASYLLARGHLFVLIYTTHVSSEDVDDMKSYVIIPFRVVC